MQPAFERAFFSACNRDGIRRRYLKLASSSPGAGRFASDKAAHVAPTDPDFEPPVVPSGSAFTFDCDAPLVRAVAFARTIALAFDVHQILLHFAARRRLARLDGRLRIGRSRHARHDGKNGNLLEQFHDFLDEVGTASIVQALYQLKVLKSA